MSTTGVESPPLWTDRVSAELSTGTEETGRVVVVATGLISSQTPGLRAVRRCPAPTVDPHQEVAGDRRGGLVGGKGERRRQAADRLTSERPQSVEDHVAARLGSHARRHLPQQLA